MKWMVVEANVGNTGDAKLLIQSRRCMMMWMGRPGWRGWANKAPGKVTFEQRPLEASHVGLWVGQVSPRIFKEGDSVKWRFSLAELKHALFSSLTKSSHSVFSPLTH